MWVQVSFTNHCFTIWNCCLMNSLWSVLCIMWYGMFNKTFLLRVSDELSITDSQFCSDSISIVFHHSDHEVQEPEQCKTTFIPTYIRIRIRIRTCTDIKMNIPFPNPRWPHLRTFVRKCGANTSLNPQTYERAFVNTRLTLSFYERTFVYASIPGTQKTSTNQITHTILRTNVRNHKILLYIKPLEVIISIDE